LDRRSFLWQLPLLGIFGLSGCKNLLEPAQLVPANKSTEDLIYPGSVADFLLQRGMTTAYSQQTDWDFGSGLLFLTRLGNHPEGAYEYFISDARPMGAINLVPYNGRQKLTIKRNGVLVWGYKPSVLPDADLRPQISL